ncbi:serpin family protein [Nocardioides ginsengisoli]|uniref:Serpin family protein n=1 Tax=Nocardioides ginsengisoli TaxID=363868 RepID=A0ABW3W7C1_9ACTN
MQTSLDRRAALQLGLLATAGAGILSACGGGEPELHERQTADRIQLVASDTRRAAGDPSLLPEVVAGLHHLAGGLYGGLAATPGNLVLSPYSVLVALGMTLTGAAGTTAAEMRKVVGAERLGERWHQGVNALIRRIDGLAEKKVALASADQLFGQRGVHWERDFLDLLAKEYGAGLRLVDYAKAYASARGLINGWVEQQTHDRIADLVPEGAIDAMTRLVLVNAIYLKARWADPFEKSMTTTGDFHRADGSVVKADLMRKPGLQGNLVTGGGWRAVTIPYEGDRLAMSVILPDDRPGALERVERQVRTEGFAGFTTGGTLAGIDLTLPRWSFRRAAALKELLASLGMPTAFSDAADFSAMTTQMQLAISEVLHQGFIAVDEHGTEAAAATAVIMTETSAPAEVATFVVDRPFLFVIHDTELGAPLFAGRVTDPTEVVE